MASPLAVLRRNQKTLLAIFGVIIMIVFVMGYSLNDLLRRDGVDRSRDVVVTWQDGNYDEAELHHVFLRHRLAHSFIEQVARETIEKKGTPRAFRLEEARSEDDLLEIVLLAGQAKESGVVVSDDAVSDFLRRVSDDQLGPSDWNRILREIVSDRRQLNISSDQIIDQLKDELAARSMWTMMSSGIAVTPPGSAWEYYNRLNRRVKAEILPIPVADFVDKVTEPTDVQLQQFYDKHKSDFSYPDSPDPGFKKRKRIAVSYVKIDFTKLLDAEMEKLTDEEIQKEYDERVARGEFKTPELPPSAGKSKNSKETDESKGDEKEPQKDTPEQSEPESDKPTSTKPAEPGTPPSAPDSESPKGKEASTETPKGESPKCEPADEANSASQKDGKSNDSPSANSQPSETPEKKAEPNTDNAATPQKKTDDAKPAPADADPKQSDDKNANEAKSDEPNAKEAKASDDTESKDEAAPDKPKYRPLSEVRDVIARSLARPRAQKVLEGIVGEAKRELDKYTRQFNEWKAFGEGTEPKLDHHALADQLKIVADEVPLSDVFVYRDHELGKSWMGQSEFLQLAFADRTQMNRAIQTQGANETEYLWWKTAEDPSKVPELAEIRAEVLIAWKMKEALTFAKAEAEKIAQEAKGKSSLKEIYGDRVIETPDFSWLTTGTIPLAWGGTPTISEVPGVDMPGQSFMESVFALRTGDVGVAVNQPQTVEFVVRIASELQSESDRRERFLGARPNELQALAQMERIALMRDWLGKLKLEQHVNWRRPPRSYGADYEG